MLVDGGSSDQSSVGTYRIEPFLLSQGVRKLEYVFVTHGDADHINGIQELLQNQKQGVEIDGAFFCRRKNIWMRNYSILQK